MFPFHIWLPEAHVQAPTEGSVILASLLLKLGGYGFLRVLIPMFPKAVVFFSPIFFLLGICGVVYCSLTSIVQVDLKKLVAYSSVAHMSMVVLGLFSLTHQGLQGALFLMLAHGISSSALFFLVGFLYDRHHTRSIYYYGGLVQPMPVFVLFFMIFLFANVSFPGTANFVGELLLFVGVFEFSPWVAFFAGFSIVLSTIYSFWIFNRIAFLNLKHSRITKFRDLSRIEVHTLFLFVFLVVFLGVYPDIALDTTYFSIKNLVFVLENN